jgi:hypothetical protein
MGQDTPDICFTCLQGEDNVEHILAQCPYARLVWTGCPHATGLRVDILQVGDTLEGWWLEARSRVTVANRRRFDTLVILVARTLWKQRNARVFANASQQFGTEQIILRIREEFSLWMFAKFGGSYATTGE